MRVGLGYGFSLEFGFSIIQYLGSIIDFISSLRLIFGFFSMMYCPSAISAAVESMHFSRISSSKLPIDSSGFWCVCIQCWASALEKL